MLMSAVEGKTLQSVGGLSSPLPSLATPIAAWPLSGDDRSSRRILRRDRLQSVPPVRDVASWSSTKAGSVDGIKEVDTVDVDPVQRVFQLERNLRFLREQHKLVLNSLHAEVEELKAKNKELQFHLVMGSDIVDKTKQLSLKDKPVVSNDCEVSVRNKVEKSVMTDAKMAVGEEHEQEQSSQAKMQMLHMENQELQTALHDARNRNMYLVTLIEQIKRHQIPDAPGKRQKPYEMHHMQSNLSSVCEFPAVYAHKFEEYEDVIQQLRRDNVELQGELSRVKGTLREVLSSNKWTPETYMIARSVLQEGMHGKDYYHRLPRIPVRPQHEPPRRSSLPAIGQHGFNSYQAMRTQQTLPNVLQSKPPRGNASNSGRHENRYKPPSSQKRQQRNHVS